MKHFFCLVSFFSIVFFGQIAEAQTPNDPCTGRVEGALVFNQRDGFTICGGPTQETPPAVPVVAPSIAALVVPRLAPVPIPASPTLVIPTVPVIAPLPPTLPPTPPRIPSPTPPPVIPPQTFDPAARLVTVVFGDDIRTASAAAVVCLGRTLREARRGTGQAVCRGSEHGSGGVRLPETRIWEHPVAVARVWTNDGRHNQREWCWREGSYIDVAASDATSGYAYAPLDHGCR